MGMIDRYKKSGGFYQLLELIETCGPTKQEKLLSLVTQEAPNWGEALKAKMLSMERILLWPEQALAEIFVNIQDLTLSTALHGFSEADKEKVFKYFGHLHKRRIEGLIDEKQPKEAEVSAAYTKIIEEVRQRLKDGTIRAEEIDPSLSIENGIEEQLAKGAILSLHVAPDIETELEDEDVLYPSSERRVANPASAGPPDQGAEVISIKKKLVVLRQEKAQLQEENRILKDKLEQIRKIA